jgi:hypothetical protein
VRSLNPVTGLLRVDPLSDMPKDHLSDVVVQLNNVLDLFDFDTVTGTSIHRLRPSGGSFVRRLTPMLIDPVCCMLYSAFQRTIRRLEVKFATMICPSPG